MKDFTPGSFVVLDERISFFLETMGFERGRSYRIEQVEIVPKETILPKEYIEWGYIPDLYARHLTHGIRTTNHDAMGCDRFVYIDGKKYSGAYFNHATAE